jgi:hypothetical protein
MKLLAEFLELAAASGIFDPHALPRNRRAAGSARMRIDSFLVSGVALRQSFARQHDHGLAAGLWASSKATMLM